MYFSVNHNQSADLTVVQMTIVDTLHQEDKPQKDIAEKAGCLQSAVLEHINENVSGREQCGRKGLEEASEGVESGWCQWIKNHRHRCLQERDYRRCIPNIKPLLN